MAYTNINASGRIYDVGETGRLVDALDKQEKGFQELEKSTTTKKDIIRYAIIGIGSILVLVLLRFAVKKK